MDTEEQLAFIKQMQADIERTEQQSATANRANMLQLESVLADKFRELREERGWSQVHLSQRLAAWGFDMHQTTIAKLEAGKRPLRVAEMFALAHVFRLPVGAVFFMARTGADGEVGYDALTRDLAALDETMQSMRQVYLEQLEHVVDLLGDYQTRRNHLVDTMRAVARDEGREDG